MAKERSEVDSCGHEHVTEELLERLLASTSIEGYLSAVEPDLEGRDLAEYLRDLLERKGLGRAQAIAAAGLNATFGYQVFQGTRYIGRDRALMLAFGMGCTLHEAQRLLRLAGHAELWSRRRRDAIVIFCLERGLSREDCDDELYRMGEETLLPAEG